jgi:hypothetical protein
MESKSRMAALYDGARSLEPLPTSPRLDCQRPGYGCSTSIRRGKAEPGYVWLDVPGKVRHVGEHELEFTNEPASTLDPR